jgi:hypothetical protein
VELSQGANSAIELWEELAFTPSAASAYAALRKTLAACNSFVITVGSIHVNGNIVPVAAPIYGDESTTYLKSEDAGSVDQEESFLLAQKGRYIVYLAYSNGRNFGLSQLQTLIPQALAKIPG